MTADFGPNCSVAWLFAAVDPKQVAGAAFLVNSQVAVTCAHVVRDHLALGEETPAAAPGDPVVLRFEAVGREVGARVIPGGWRPKGWDVALLQLDERLGELEPAGLARAQPRPRESCYIYGAIAGYQGTGQTVYAELAVQRGVDGRRQLNAPSGGQHGYKVLRGFSGAPVFDELGNVIWGMVVTVETDPGIYIAFSIPAEDLREALRAVRAEPAVGNQLKDHAAEPVDDLARDAMAALRQEYEQRLAKQRESYEQQIQELRQAVQTVAGMAREPATGAPAIAALEHLKRGDREPAEQLLQLLLDGASERTAEERQQAAALARSLGVLAYLDNTDRALRAYEITTQLDPGDIWAWIFLSRLNRRANRLGPAEQALERARDAALTSGGERTISVVHTDLGDVRVARGDLPHALEAYSQGLTIDKRLVDQDPTNSEWQRDLSISSDKIGDVQSARGNLDAALSAYQDSLAIREKLAAQDPSNSGWQRDLSISFDRIGNVQSARGNLDAALSAYQDSLAIAEKLAAQDPSNSGWQRDLSVSFDRIGNVQSARGNLDAALSAYQDSLAIREKLAAQDPTNSEWQRDLTVSHWQLADLAEQQSDESTARRHWQAALAIAKEMDATGRLAPPDAHFVETIEARLVQLSEEQATP